jgi:hypothetical protein
VTLLSSESVGCVSMESLIGTFAGLLHQYSPHSSQPLWGITTREHLFKHLTQSRSNLIGQSTYSIRIDGALQSLDSFLDLVREINSATKDESTRWEAMVWGSSALVLAVSRIRLRLRLVCLLAYVDSPAATVSAEIWT